MRFLKKPCFGALGALTDEKALRAWSAVSALTRRNDNAVAD
jgi:hypothetical protein